MEVVASLSQGRTAAAECGLFTHKSVPVIFEPPCTFMYIWPKITYSLCICGLMKHILYVPVAKYNVFFMYLRYD